MKVVMAFDRKSNRQNEGFKNYNFYSSREGYKNNDGNSIS